MRTASRVIWASVYSQDVSFKHSSSVCPYSLLATNKTLLKVSIPVTGVNFIFYYGTSFFANSGIQNPFIVSIITSIVNILSTIPGLYAVDKFGRRSVLLAGAIGMAVTQVSLRPELYS